MAYEIRFIPGRNIDILLWLKIQADFFTILQRIVS